MSNLSPRPLSIPEFIIVPWIPIYWSLKITQVQGDHSGCDKHPVDFKTKVAFQYMGLILIRNFCFEANESFETTLMVTLYSNSHFSTQGVPQSDWFAVDEGVVYSSSLKSKSKRHPSMIHSRFERAGTKTSYPIPDVTIHVRRIVMRNETAGRGSQVTN